MAKMALYVGTDLAADGGFTFLCLKARPMTCLHIYFLKNIGHVHFLSLQSSAFLGISTTQILNARFLYCSKVLYLMLMTSAISLEERLDWSPAGQKKRSKSPVHSDVTFLFLFAHWYPSVHRGKAIGFSK